MIIEIPLGNLIAGILVSITLEIFIGWLTSKIISTGENNE